MLQNKEKKERATARIRVYPTTRRKLNVKAARREKTVAELVDFLNESEGRK